MSAPLAVRVMVLDTWDEVPLTLPPATSIADLKRAALAHSRIRRAPGEYVVKYNGAELYEPGNTLANAGVVPNGALIVLRRRRNPVR
ncbi:MAG TPA: hypothetical protein VFU23_14370 [Gemmatimonadales bacterium]|nr:hypothetical protein [Gemmatimonadales bacterium]